MDYLSAGFKLAERLKALPLYRLERKAADGEVLAKSIFNEISSIYKILDFKKSINYLGPLVIADQLIVGLKESKNHKNFESEFNEIIQKINNLI